MHCNLKTAQRWTSHCELFLAKFVRCISKHTLKILTPPLDLATPISYMVWIFWQLVGIYQHFDHIFNVHESADDKPIFRAIIYTPDACADFKYIAIFQNQTLQAFRGNWGQKLRPNLTLFDPPPVKIRGGVSKMCE